MKGKRRMKIAEKLKSLVMYVLIGLLDYLVYFIMMVPAAGYLNGQPALPEGKHHPLLYVLFAICAVVYVIPIYFTFFCNNVGLKTNILHITSAEMGGYSNQKALSYVMREQGISDLAVYAVYSLFMLLPFAGPERNPFIYILMQETFFHVLPIPSILGWILSVLFFGLQYLACAYIVSNKWNKNRIRA